MDQLIRETLGRHLQGLRVEHGLSLSQLAADSNIAKSNLSRLEQGFGNPTLDTLWRLAVRLNVPFGTLIQPISVPIGNDGIQVKLLDQGKDNPNVDAYWMSCAPDTLREAEAHSPGSREIVTIISGRIDVGTTADVRSLSAGETHTFGCDKPHIYRTSEVWTTLLVVIIYEAEEARTS
jgi:transcriptional regulator with XRE-family HTH domain